MKNKIVLLVSMLLPLVSSCEEKPTLEPTVDPTVEPTTEIVYNYKESEYSEELCSASIFSKGEILPQGNSGISNFVEEESINYLMHCTGESDDYYTCAFIHESDILFMDSFIKNEKPIPGLRGYGDLNYLAFFAGINTLFNKYSSFANEIKINNLELDYTFHQIKWYEIPKGEEIPEYIGDYQLALISIGKKFDFYDLDNNFQYSKTFFIEQIKEKYYNKSKNNYFSIQLRLFNDMQDLIKVNNKYLININRYGSQHINGDDLYRDIFFGSVMIENIEGEEYVGFFHTRYDGDDDYLKKQYDYFVKNGYYYFKLSDIISFIKSKKQAI